MILLLLFLLKTYAQCDIGTYFDISRGVCFDCPSECFECAGPPDDSSTQCITCRDPMKIEDSGNCISPCRLLKNCDICGLQCKVCTMTQCIQCFSPYLLFFPGCVEVCPEGYYAENLQCLPCDKSCSICSGAGNTGCSACQAGFDFFQGRCIKPSCGDGFVTGGEECDDAKDANCFECKVVYCGINQFWNGSSCSNCSAACEGCLGSESQCFKCADGLLFNNDSCQQSFCGDGIRSGDEECDDDQSDCRECKLIACKSPEILKTSYFQDFQGFFTAFDRKVQCAGCEIFENSVLLGEDPICYCEDFQLNVKFGKQFTWDYRSSLQINANVLGTCNDQILISLTGSDPIFSLRISAKKDLTTCSTRFELSAQVSSKTPIKQFNWTVVPDSQAIQPFLTSLNPSIPIYLLKNSAFQFILTIQNFLGQTLTEEYFRNFSDLSNLTIIIPSYLKVEQKHEIFLRARLETCQDFAKSFFDWEVLNENLTKIEKYGNIAKVVNKVFDKGDSIQVKVSAWTGETDRVSKIVTLEYESSELEAVIDKRCIFSSEASLVLHANRSTYAGKTEGLAYHWAVFKGTEVFFNSSASSIVLKNDGSMFEVVLTASKSGLSDKDSTFVKFSEENSWISSETLRIHTGQEFFFSKSKNSSYWTTNTECRSDKYSNLGKFLSPPELKNPWVGTNQDCRVQLKPPVVPSGGFLEVFPEHGTAWKTVFTIKAVGWSEGCLFEFWFKVSERFERLTDLLYASSFSTVLPYSERLEVKVRVYSLTRSYSESFKQVLMQKNEENKKNVFDVLLKDVKSNDFEYLLQTGSLLMHLVRDELGESAGKTLISNQSTEVQEYFRGHLTRVLNLASLYLPTNNQLNEMVLHMLFGLVTTKKMISFKEIVSICLIIRKRYQDTLSYETKLKVLDIVDSLLTNHRNLNSNLFRELENLLTRVGLSLARSSAYEPVKYIYKEIFLLQCVKSYPGRFSSASEAFSLQNDAKFFINSDSEVNFALIKYLNPSVIGLSNSSVVVQVESKGKVNGMVSMATDSAQKSRCRSVHQVLEGTVQDSLVWCAFNSSDRLLLELFNFSSENSEKTEKSWKSIMFVGIFLLINTFWLLWAVLKDKKQLATVFPELLEASSTSFLSSIKNCHSFLNIFMRFDIEKPRYFRVLIYDCRILSMILTLMSLKLFLSPLPLLLTAEFSSFLVGKLLTNLLKKHKRQSIKKLPEPPDLRYSPTIKLPELSAKTKYTYVRHFNESNPVNDTSFTYESKYEHNKTCLILSLFLMAGLWIVTLRDIVLQGLTFWKSFLIVLASDHMIVQLLSISVQFFGLRKFQVFKKVVSKSMNNSTDVNNSVV